MGAPLSKSRPLYAEQSSESSADSGDDLSHGSHKPAASLLSTSPGMRAPQSKKRKARISRDAPAKKYVIDQADHPVDRAEHKVTNHSSPPWHTLPYQILFQIFQYASDPLYNDCYQPNPTVAWLLQAALTCQSFTEPALSALYYSPPLTSPAQMKALVAHLGVQNPESVINYQSKINCIDVEALFTLTVKHNGQYPDYLADLVRLTPQLKFLGIHLLRDKPCGRRLGSQCFGTGRTVYRESLFTALEETKISLLCWKWNFCFNCRRALAHPHSFPWRSLKELHRGSPFVTLRSLRIAWYDVSMCIDEVLLAGAISALPNLKHLSFEVADLGNGDLLPKLPRSLESLHISECACLTSDMLYSFLLTHGGNLRELVLDYNQSLSLSFLVILAVACPQLRCLKMDLTFHSSFTTFSDSNPNFETLLSHNQIPTWPRTLQSLELLHLRKWDATSAENLFASLISSAIELPDLRRLILKASIEIGWRDRAVFRDRWIGTMQKVFLRKSTLPLLPPGTGRSKEFQIPRGKPPAGGHADGPTALRFRLRGTRSNRPNYVEADEHEPIAERSNQRRSRRQTQQETDIQLLLEHRKAREEVASRMPIHPNEMSRDDTASEIDDGLQSHRKSDEPAIQGMCDIVDIRIDNLRPAELQFLEKDFLDEEVSGDEDWVGDNSSPPHAYAW